MEAHHDEALFRSVFQPGRRTYLLAGLLLAIVGWGIFAYVYQLRQGLGVTGLNRPVFWGLYITNFVFFIGISHAGTLVSAILRITGGSREGSRTRVSTPSTGM